MGISDWFGVLFVLFTWIGAVLGAVFDEQAEGPGWFDRSILLRLLLDFDDGIESE